MFPVVDLNGKLIDGKQEIWGLAVMNYLELVAVVGIVITTMDGLVDMSTLQSFPFLQCFEVVAYFIIIRVEEQISTWYVFSMLIIGVGIILRTVLNIGFVGLPALLESQENFKIRAETNSYYKFFIPAGTKEGEVNDMVAMNIRQTIFFLVIRSVIVVVISSLLFRFIERARELDKYNRKQKCPEDGELVSNHGLSATKGRR